MKQQQPERFMLSAQIYPAHFFTVLTMTTICANLFVSPTAYLDGAGRAAWALVLLSYLGGLLLVLIAWGLARQFPNECLPQYLPRLLGKIPGGAISLLFAALLIVNITEDTRTSVITGTAGLLVYTPLPVTVGLFAFLATYQAWTGHVRFARGSTFYFSLVVGTFALLLVLTRRWMDLGYLRPLLDFTQWRPYTLSFWAGFATFRPAILLLMLYPYVQDKRKVLPLSVAAVTVAALVLGLATVAPIAVLGLEGAQRATRPFIYMVTTIFFADAPFETFDFFARLLLLNNSIFTITVMTWAAGRLVRTTLAKSATDGPFIWGAAAVAWGLQFFWLSAVEFQLMSYWIIVAVFAFGLALAPLIPLAAWKARRGQLPKKKQRGGPAPAPNV